MFAAGSLGLGFVWGWLVALVWNRATGKRPLATANALFLGTATVLFPGWYLFSSSFAGYFLVATVTAVAIHTIWLWQLRRRAR